MYRQAKVKVGHLQEEYIQAVFMPREDFLGVVQDTLDSLEDYSLIAAKVLKTAQTMDRFPFGTWIHNRRGCGCLVGEMLVADEVIDVRNRTAAHIPIDDELVLDIRRKLAQSPTTTNFKTVDRLLRERHPSGYVNVLIEFGETIDNALAEHLDKAMPDWNADTIIIEDS